MAVNYYEILCGQSSSCRSIQHNHLMRGLSAQKTKTFIVKSDHYPDMTELTVHFRSKLRELRCDGIYGVRYISKENINELYSEKEQEKFLSFPDMQTS